LAHVFRKIENDSYRQRVVLAGELHQWLPGFSLYVRRIDDRQSTRRQSLRGDVVQHVEGVLRRSLIVLVVADQATAIVARQHFRWQKVLACKCALPGPQLIQKASLTSFQDIRRAHPARYHAYSCVIVRLPSAQGTRSTFTPQVGQLTRRIVYTNTTAIPHNGTKSKCRGVGIVSYPGRRSPQPEQTGRPLARGLTSTSTVGLAAFSRQAIFPNTNDL
jgi:hypothetical protein